MVDVFISYPQKERALMLPLKGRLEALDLDLFVDVDGRLDGSPTFPEALDKGVRAAKAVLGCWSPLALTREWVKNECAIARDQNKLVAVERVRLTPDDVPAEFYRVDRKDLTDFQGEECHEGWAQVLRALAAKLRLWVEKNPAHPDAGQAQAKVARLEYAALAERSPAVPRDMPPDQRVYTPFEDTSSKAWSLIEASLDNRDYAMFEELFPAAPETLLSARHRRQLEEWERIDRTDLDIVTAFLHAAPFAALELVVRKAVACAARARLHLDYCLMPEMVIIPPGKFVMGAPTSEECSRDNEDPQHEVSINYAFALCKYTVTFAEWNAALAAGADLRDLDGSSWHHSDRPVVNVSWEDAQSYIAWLNAQLGLEGEAGAYRLPSEAEWEYACRAGTQTPFSSGSTISTAEANYDGNATYGTGKRGDFRQTTTPVGMFRANAFGLHDMHGNIWEWCEDVWHDDYLGAPADGSAWTSGGDSWRRVLRGGAWDDDPEDLRSAARNGDDSTGRFNDVGFRLARTILDPKS